MRSKQGDLLKAECSMKPKLRTFIILKKIQNLPPHFAKPLSFIERKTISKLRLGVLPVRLETARYLGPIVPEDQRFCYCMSSEIESEAHVLFSCKVYADLRDAWLENLCITSNFNDLPLKEKLDIVLNVPENVKPTGKFLVNAMDLRSLQEKAYK